MLDGQSHYATDYNNSRLHSAIGYITPRAKLEGREPQILKERDAKLEAARAGLRVWLGEHLQHLKKQKL